MNRQPLEYPENTAEYQDGVEAKQLGLTERACPWGSTNSTAAAAGWPAITTQSLIGGQQHET